MKKAVFAALALCACASSEAGEGWTMTTNAQRVPWENNQTAWLITCSAGLEADCFRRAAAVCPANGYLIISDRRTELMVACKP